ncbi:DUF5060 domain-containing protein [Paenarthrobacter sp. NPDC090009]
MDYARLSGEAADQLLADLSAVPVADKAEEPAIPTDPNYESDEVDRGSARVTLPQNAEQNDTCELVFAGPSHGNPFVDVDLTATFRCADRTVNVGGFYDGEGCYRLRFLPPEHGPWSFLTTSNARSLDGIEGQFRVAPSNRPGPVRADGCHFRYDNGDPFIPVGTTLYAWTHQDDVQEARTLQTLAEAPYNKVRMCVFPKHYEFNSGEPPRYPFEQLANGQWDTTRFDVKFFDHLERRILDLGRLGIQADLILFHPYDRWGFQSLGAAADDRYTQYVVRRLAALPNVWWSLANEYDLMADKRDEDWERIGLTVADADPVGHLLSIHNGTRIFDFTRPWITHCSIQKTDPASPVPHIEEWFAKWSKPIIIDELGYEGDIQFEWGSLSGEELVHRFWEIAVRGAYATHGETFANQDNLLWWAAGGELVGNSTERIRLLAQMIAECPTGHLEPLSGHFHLRGAGVRGVYELHYLGHYQPRSLKFDWPEGTTADVEIIDTWTTTVDTVPGDFTGPFELSLPGRPNLAVRIRRRPNL